MEGDDNRAPQGEPLVQPDFATPPVGTAGQPMANETAQPSQPTQSINEPINEPSQPINEPANEPISQPVIEPKPSVPQTSIDPNKPQVRRERKWHKFAIPILSVAAVAIVGLIIYLALNVTGVIDTIAEITSSEENAEEETVSQPITYNTEEERMLAQADSAIATGDFESDEALAIQAELEKYMENIGDIDSYEKAIATVALARLYLAQDNRAGEGVQLLEELIGKESTSDEAKVYFLLELYDYYVKLGNKFEQYNVLSRVMEFPNGMPMTYDNFDSIASSLWDTYLELTDYVKNTDPNTIDQEDNHDD